jgi:hypothetical protein
MHHHAGLLVYHDHILIFMEDVKREVFREQLQFPGWVGQDHRNQIPGLYLVAGFDRNAVGKNVPGVGCRLDPAPGGTFKSVEKELVYSEGSLARIGSEPEMLV